MIRRTQDAVGQDLNFLKSAKKHQIFDLNSHCFGITTMSSTPKRQKNRDGSYTPTPADGSEPPLRRKAQPLVTKNDPDDPLLAAYNNPYLAHMLPDEGYSPNVQASRGPLRDFVKRNTTAAQAAKAEDGPENPFTLRPLSHNYFNILQKRRELPVHAQRYVCCSIRSNS